MIAYLLQLVGGLVSWLTSVLPQSPFAGLTLALGGFANVLGWVNWAIPIGQIATLFGAWLLAAAVWQVVQFVMSRFDAVTSLFGGRS